MAQEEKPAAKKPRRRRKSLLNEAKADNRLNTLKRLRDKVAETIDNTESGRDVASLTCQLRAVLAEIDEIEKEGGKGLGGTVVADVMERAHERR